MFKGLSLYFGLKYVQTTLNTFLTLTILAFLSLTFLLPIYLDYNRLYTYEHVHSWAYSCKQVS